MPLTPIAECGHLPRPAAPRRPRHPGPRGAILAARGAIPVHSPGSCTHPTVSEGATTTTAPGDVARPPPGGRAGKPAGPRSAGASTHFTPAAHCGRPPGRGPRRAPICGAPLASRGPTVPAARLATLPSGDKSPTGGTCRSRRAGSIPRNRHWDGVIGARIDHPQPRALPARRNHQRRAPAAAIRDRRGGENSAIRASVRCGGSDSTEVCILRAFIGVKQHVVLLSPGAPVTPSGVQLSGGSPPVDTAWQPCGPLPVLLPPVALRTPIPVGTPRHGRLDRRVHASRRVPYRLSITPAQSGGSRRRRRRVSATVRREAADLVRMRPRQRRGSQ